MVPRSLRTLLAAATLASLICAGNSRGTTRALAAPYNLPLATALDAFLAPVASPASAPGPDVAAAEAQFLDLLNSDRTANGLSTLQPDARLMDLARWRSEDMVARNYFSHDIGGFVVAQVLRDRQIPFRLAGENLAYATYDDARTVPAAEGTLMSSTGHRANILRAEFNYVGVGVAAGPDGRVVFTQIFIQADTKS